VSKVARLFLRSAAFRCDGRKNRGPTKQVAPQVGEHSTWSCTSLTVEVLPLSPPKSASHKRGGIWLRAEFLRGPFSLSCNDQVEIPICEPPRKANCAYLCTALTGYPLNGLQRAELRSVPAHRFWQEYGARFGVRSSPKPPAYTETTTTCDFAASRRLAPASRTP